MQDIERELLELKDQALEATKRKDGAFYSNYLADDAIAVVPFGIFDKQAVVQQMSGDSPFRSLHVDDTRAVVLNRDAGLVTYKATFESTDSDKKTFQVFVTTVYARIDGAWKGVHYQQTPLQTQGV
jgi:ketosteroid isomerase-like protein